jgi:threonine aldolase
MKKMLKEKQPLLERKQHETNEYLVKVESEQVESERIKEIVDQETLVVNDQQIAIKSLTDEAQSELDIILPQLDEAKEELKKISKDDINELKS